MPAKHDRSDNPMFTPEQRELIEKHILEDAPSNEVERFIITCERTGLDPFSRQIYGHVQQKKVKRGSQEIWIPTVVIITSIDGFRAIAERSGEYRGQTPPEWYYVNDEGKSAWHDVFITPRDPRGNPLKVPDACRVGILRKDFPAPCYGVANFNSFAKYYKAEGQNGRELETFWKKMPEHMIAKIAEAQGHRKAFPLLACGLYVEEEAHRQEEDGELLPPGEPTPTGTIVSSPAPRQEAPPEASETPAAPETLPAPEKPAKAAPKAKKAAPATPPEPEQKKEPEPPAPEAGAEWQDYAISQIAIARFNGKKLSELSHAELANLKIGWADKYGEKFKNNPAKAKEVAMITAAYEATKPA